MSGFGRLDPLTILHGGVDGEGFGLIGTDDVLFDGLIDPEDLCCDPGSADPWYLPPDLFAATS